ncbi:MAG: hypothetical protein FJX59_06660 [Alphaproteobacteria bacterium]|nr:hypothetical protein [Alphaproteobacteria bacterium]
MAKIENIKTPRRAKAMRPQYFTDPNMDQMHAMIVAMATEISVLYDRFDSLERVLEKKGSLVRADLEAWQADDAAHDERRSKRDALIRRIFRVVHDARGALDAS